MCVKILYLIILGTKFKNRLVLKLPDFTAVKFNYDQQVMSILVLLLIAIVPSASTGLETALLKGLNVTKRHGKICTIL